jgi:hypothetical protein
MTISKLLGVVALTSALVGCDRADPRTPKDLSHSAESSATHPEATVPQTTDKLAETEAIAPTEAVSNPGRPMQVSWSEPVSQAVLVTEPPDIVHVGGEAVGTVEAVIKIEYVQNGKIEETTLDSEKQYFPKEGVPIVIRDNGESVWGVVARMIQGFSDTDSEGKIKIAFFRGRFADRQPGSSRKDEDRVSEWLELQVRPK